MSLRIAGATKFKPNKKPSAISGNVQKSSTQPGGARAPSMAPPKVPPASMAAPSTAPASIPSKPGVNIPQPATEGTNPSNALSPNTEIPPIPSPPSFVSSSQALPPSSIPDLTQGSTQGSISEPLTPPPSNSSHTVIRQASIPPSPEAPTSRRPSVSASPFKRPTAPPKSASKGPPALIAAAAAASVTAPVSTPSSNGLPPSFAPASVTPRPPPPITTPSINSGLPPSFASTTQSTTFGLPPSIAPVSSAPPTISSSRGDPSIVSSNAQAGPSRLASPVSVHTLAAALVGTITPALGLKPPRKKAVKPRGRPQGNTKRAAARAAAARASARVAENGEEVEGDVALEEDANGDQLDADPDEEYAEDQQVVPAKKTGRRIDKPTRVRGKRKRPFAGEPEEDVEGEADRASPTKASQSGSTRDQRADFTRRKAPVNAHPELEGVNANDMVGEEIDAATMTMGQLATSLAAEGRVSARALRLHQFKKEDDKRKQVERVQVLEALWQRKQIQRRKYRAAKNRDRAERRRLIGEHGGDEGEVSNDSADSEEDYELDPDRLTPPASPERGGRRALPRGDERAGTELGEDYGERADSLRGPTPLFDPDFLDDDGQEQQDEVPPPGLAQDDEEDDDPRFANLGAMRFSPTVDDGDYNRLQLDDDGNLVDMGPDIDRFREERENRRQMIMSGADGRTVEVIDSETTFINSNSFGKNGRGERWSDVETELFYMILGEVGENYTLMKAYFPGRTVKQLKRKGVRENRVNPSRVTSAILHRQPIDKDYLAKSAGYDVNRPFDREQELMDEAHRDAEIARAITNGTAILDEDGRPMVGNAPLAITNGEPLEDVPMDDGADFETTFQVDENGNEKDDGDDDGGGGKGDEDDGDKGDEEDGEANEKNGD